MENAFPAGFALGLSLILAIGAQNAFVLKQGLRRAHVFAVCLICALSDAILIVVGVTGFGWLSASVVWLADVMRWGGALFLLGYGALSFRAAYNGGQVLEADGQSGALAKALGTCLALTWLNPHVYLDTVALLGSVSAQYQDRFGFGLGAITASFTFFFSLGYGARFLAPLFAQPQAWRVLDVVIGCVMWAIAFSLLTH